MVGQTMNKKNRLDSSFHRDRWMNQLLCNSISDLHAIARLNLILNNKNYENQRNAGQESNSFDTMDFCNSKLHFLRRGYFNVSGGPQTNIIRICRINSNYTGIFVNSLNFIRDIICINSAITGFEI